MAFKIRILTTLCMLCAALPALPAADRVSALWGRDGEAWTPNGRLPDFSHAGYQSGEVQIPTPPVKASVKQFGAKGDGVTDDTKAFEAAIEAAGNGALLVPKGRYVITRVLYIRKSNFVLRGEGPGKTVLVFPKPLLEVLGPKPGTGEYDNWSWAGGFLWVEGRESNRRLADITADAARGSQVVRVSTTAGLAAGQMVRLKMTDRNGSLGRHIHAGEMDMHPWLLNKPLVRFPARVGAARDGLVTLSRPMRLDARREWQAGLYSVQPGIQEVGLEGFSMEFPSAAYPGHYKEKGANGIWMDGAWNSWVKDVAIRNADCGIMLENSTFCTVTRVRFTASPEREVMTPKGMHQGRHSGHHGIQMRGGDDCLVSYFLFETRFLHDLTVEDTTGNVFMKGKGVDICFDHHTHIPYENLFTEIDIGEGTRPFLSNGSVDPESGARETFWNIQSDTPLRALATRKGTWPQVNIVGMATTLAPATGATGAWIETMPPGQIRPSNLYLAQLAKRRKPEK